MNETILNVLKAMDKEAPATIDMIEKVEKEKKEIEKSEDLS